MIGFLSVGTGTSRGRTLRISNLARTGVLVGNVSAAAPFFVTAGAGGFELAGHQSDTVTVKFQPTVPGRFSGTLMINSNDPVHPSVGVLLTGAGSAGRLAIPPHLAFPKIAAGTSSARRLSLRNAGLGVLHGNLGAISGPFTMIAGSAAFVLDHNQSTSVTVQFNPEAPDAYSGALNVTSDDPEHSSVVVSLAGSAR